VATKKQRRRREKGQRHEYEIVYVDDEGNEVEPEDAPVRAPAPRASSSRGKSGKSGKAAPLPRRGRAPQPPSWQRVLKRGAIFAPLFLVTVMLIDRKHMTLARAVVQTALLLVLFVPFSYFLDSLMWRSHQKRLGGGSAAKR
jgi:hypothetical protein